MSGESSKSSSSAGEAKNLGQVVLSQIAVEDDTKMTFTHEELSAHYITHKNDPETEPMGVTFLVVVKCSVSRRVAFILLMNMERLYNERKQTLQEGTAAAASGKDKFVTPADLKKLCDSAESGTNDLMGIAQTEIDQVKNIMIENVERILERGERINLLVSKTDRMNTNAIAFRKRSTAVQRSLWWSNVKFTTILATTGAAVIYIIMGIECGFPGLSHCSG